MSTSIDPKQQVVFGSVAHGEDDMSQPPSLLHEASALFDDTPDTPAVTKQPAPSASSSSSAAFAPADLQPPSKIKFDFDVAKVKLCENPANSVVMEMVSLAVPAPSLNQVGLDMKAAGEMQPCVMHPVEPNGNPQSPTTYGHNRAPGSVIPFLLYQLPIALANRLDPDMKLRTQESFQSMLQPMNIHRHVPDTSAFFMGKTQAQLLAMSDIQQ